MIVLKTVVWLQMQQAYHFCVSMFVCSWILTHMVGSYITRIWHTSYIYLAQAVARVSGGKQHRSYEPLIKLHGERLNYVLVNTQIEGKHDIDVIGDAYYQPRAGHWYTHTPSWDTLAISSVVICYGKCTDTLSVVSSQLNMMNQREANIETWAFHLRANVPWKWPQVTKLNDRRAGA